MFCLLSFVLFVVFCCSLFSFCFLFNTRHLLLQLLFSLYNYFSLRLLSKCQAERGSDQPGSISYLGHCAHLNSLISYYLYF